MDNFASHHGKTAKKYAMDFAFFCILPLSFFAMGRMTRYQYANTNSIMESVQADAASEYAQQYLESMPLKSPEDKRRRATASDQREEPHDPLNVVLFYADDWTLKVVGKLNHLVKTPNIDKMADNGMMFTQNCVTTSVCWISRATLMTGVYSARHRQTEPWRTVRIHFA